MGTITYENHDNISFLVYQLDPTEQLDQLSIEMLSNNRLEGVISPVLIQKDNTIFLRYNITAKVTLTSYYRDTISRQRFLPPLFSIASGMKLAENYMLDASTFLLNPEYVFIDVSTGNANMIYLPLESKDPSLHLAEFIKGLLMNIRFDSNENTAYVTQILNFCNSENFSLAGLHSLLKELVDGGSTSRKPASFATASPQSPPMAGPVSLDAFVASLQTSVPQPTPLQATAPPAAAVAPPLVPAKRKGLFSSNKQKKEKPVKQKTPKKAKNNAPLASVNFAIPGQTPPGVVPVPTAISSANIQTPPHPLQSDTAPVQQVPVSTPPLSPAVVPAVRAAAPAAKPVSFGNTMVLGLQSTSETSVLSNDSSADAPKFILVREKTGERIAITKSPYRIGKEMRYVDYCITDNTTVSRSHADFFIEDGSCYLIDNNSTNHTYVAGRMVNSNTKVPLQDNVQVIFSNEYFVFQIR